MRNLTTIICSGGFIACLLSQHIWAADDWILKGDHFSLSRQAFTNTLTARGFTAENLPPKQKQALLQELFIRESLLAQQDKVPAATMLDFTRKLEDYRRGQLAKLTLDVLSEQAMPDFSKRAQELYEVRKHEQYQLPLRLRVRVLRQPLQQPALQHVANEMHDHDGVANLQALLTRIQAGELDFRQAVLAYSDEPNRKLTGGDSFWFQQGQKPDVVFAAAAKLNAQNRMSEVIVDDEFAYVLQFIGRQEAGQQSFAEVEKSIMQELQTEYRNEQRKLLLTKLRAQFRNEAEIHPDFQ